MTSCVRFALNSDSDVYGYDLVYLNRDRLESDADVAVDGSGGSITRDYRHPSEY